MRIALALVLVFAGCTAPASQEPEVNSVTLGPSGRAEAQVPVPANSDAALRLTNRGPGRVDYVVRAGDRPLMEGQLGEALGGGLTISRCSLADTQPRTVTVVVETHETAGASVSCQLEGSGGTDVTWRVTR